LASLRKQFLGFIVLKNFILGKSMFGNNSKNYFAEWLVAEIFGAASEKQHFLVSIVFDNNFREIVFFSRRSKTFGLFEKNFLG
jgi:hypothetical protein